MSVERRIFEAAMVVLAGCDHALEPQSATQPIPEPLTEPPPMRDPVVPFPRPPEGPEAAKTLCAKHKKSAVDRSQATQAPPPPAGTQVVESSRWDAKAGVATCTIVHQRKPGTVTVLVTPHWCRQSQMPAPRPVPIDLPGEKILVERVVIQPDGTVTTSSLAWTGFAFDQMPRHMCGRRFEGLALEPRGDEPGAQLAGMAELEAASVPAFERLARELARWGAPEDLVRRAKRAMRDEVRHARVMTTLARRYGHEPRAIAVPELPCRSLAAIALENVIEGCVREAYGALIATYQAERARPELRAAFRAIAIDERRHAELAEAVHDWSLAQLDANGRTATEHARADAEQELRASLISTRPCPELGLPDAVDALALHDAYFA